MLWYILPSVTDQVISHDFTTAIQSPHDGIHPVAGNPANRIELSGRVAKLPIPCFAGSVEPVTNTNSGRWSDRR